METFNIGIAKVISEKPLTRTVRVKMIRDFYDGKKEVIVGFFLAEWEAYKHRGCYPERRELSESMIQYYEDMPIDRWSSSRHDAKLHDFTDEEIVEEFNKRLNNTLFHKIGIESRAIAKEAK